MAFVVKVPLQLVPGKDTFSAIQQAATVRLPQYGWKSVKFDSGAAGKVLVAETRTIVFYLDGKSGANQETAEKDVSDALSDVGIFARVSGKIVGALNQVPGTIATGVGDAAGKALAAGAKGAGVPGGASSLILLGGVVLILAVGVAVVAAKRG